MATTDTYVGIDISKTHLDLAVHATGEPWRVTYDTTGIKQVVTQLLAMAPTLIVVEAWDGCPIQNVGHEMA